MAEVVQQLCPISEAIIFVSRADLRPMLRKLLKEAGVEDIETPDSIDECVVELVKSDKALLVLDWTESTEETAKILSAAQGNYSADTRPILFFASEIPPDLLGLAAEYHVSKVYSGEVTTQSLQNSVSQIIHEESNLTSMRQQTAQFADSQAVGDWATANDQIRDLLDDNEGDANLLGELINNLIHEDKWDEALNTAKELRTLHPSNVRGMHLYGRCMMKKGHYKEACSVLKAANIINPFNTDRLVDLGNSLLQIDHLSEAQSNFMKALEIDSSHAGAQEGMSKCKLISGDVNEALDLLNQFSSPRELASIFNDSAIISIRQGRFKAGIQLYKAAIKSLGSNNRIIAKLLFNMGIAYTKQSDYDLAYDMFHLSIEKDNGFDHSLHNMQVCAHKLGRVEEFKRIALAIRNGEHIGSQDSKSIVDEFNESFEDESF